jgi:hypothetical protein
MIDDPLPTPEGEDQTSCPFCGQIADRSGTPAYWQCREIAAHGWPAPMSSVRPSHDNAPSPMEAPETGMGKGDLPLN